MFKRTLGVSVLGMLACGEPVDDGSDDVVDRIDLGAPLAFELAPGAQLVLADATVVGVGHGTVIIDALAIDASAGAMLDLPLADRPTALRLSGRLGTRRIVAARAPELAAEAHLVGASLVGLELGGFESAWLEDEDGERVALEEPLVVDASGLGWTRGELVVIELGDEDTSAAASAGASRAGARRGAGRPSGAVGGSADDLAHLRDDDGQAFGDDLVADGEPVTLEPGDPCSATSQCPIETRCVADTVMSDGQFRCLALCGGPELAGAPTPPTPSPSAACVDDAGCCDSARTCNNGACVADDPGDGGDGGGDGGAPSGEGCDRDDDGWVNSCDRKPDESCSHDSDDDGCNDSFDKDDDDACVCSVRLPRPNSTAITLLLLVWLRGRKRRS